MSNFIPNRRVAVNFIYTYTLLWLRLWAFFTIVVHKLIQYNTGIYFSRKANIIDRIHSISKPIICSRFSWSPILIDNSSRLSHYPTLHVWFLLIITHSFIIHSFPIQCVCNISIYRVEHIEIEMDWFVHSFSDAGSVIRALNGKDRG